MLKNYLKLQAKKFAKDNDVFDIVVYGSTIKGKEEQNDLDILLIFIEKKLKDRLETVQKFKQSIKNKFKKVDLKSINLSEIFDSNFLARQGVLIEGYSLLSNEYLSNKIGFRGCAIFSYKLTNLNHNEKTKFTYSLIGRNSKGMIKKLNGEVLGRGSIIVPIDKSMVFQDYLDSWDIKYKKKNALLSLI